MSFELKLTLTFLAVNFSLIVIMALCVNPKDRIAEKFKCAIRFFGSCCVLSLLVWLVKIIWIGVN